MFMTFYNVDMEKAKNINDLLEEYERMEAIIDLFFKKDVENKGKRLNFRHGYKNPRPHFCNRSTLIIHI